MSNRCGSGGVQPEPNGKRSSAATDLAPTTAAPVVLFIIDTRNVEGELAEKERESHKNKKKNTRMAAMATP